MNKNSLSDFQQQMQDVEPLKNKPTIHFSKPTESTFNVKARQKWVTKKPFQESNYLNMGEIEWLQPHSWLEYKKDGVQEGVYKKLRLGKYPIQSSLDLHRIKLTQAREQVWEFIKSAIKQQQRVVLIIHGKGERSEPKAQLKSYVHEWLLQLEPVIAFHSAQLQHGGLGAVYVMLKKKTAQDPKLINSI
ncbi:MAG: DNA endonuclease SmrA [Gammaproteobacteria bacterium CG22_combo_CG10-13_8_21_14_all_40_8]|nr:MAG: DNA endonuclease SmrA [Gammaproteobacteria bacterium CG22_combo_CG10-13_8_21_14_all_40_8]